jgi:hypothetical protein
MAESEESWRRNLYYERFACHSSNAETFSCDVENYWATLGVCLVVRVSDVLHRQGASRTSRTCTRGTSGDQMHHVSDQVKRPDEARNTLQTLEGC